MDMRIKNFSEGRELRFIDFSGQPCLSVFLSEWLLVALFSCLCFIPFGYWYGGYLVKTDLDEFLLFNRLSDLCFPLATRSMSFIEERDDNHHQ